MVEPNPIDDCLNKLQIKDYLLRQNELLPDRLKAKQQLLAEVLKVLEMQDKTWDDYELRTELRKAYTELFLGKEQG